MSQDQIKNLLIIMNMRFYARIMWRNDEKGWRNWWQWRYHANFHDELHETSTDQSKIMRWLILTTLFVHLTITMRESDLCKKIYQRSEFRDQKQHWKQKLCSESQQTWKSRKIQIWKWEISRISKTINKTLKHDATMDFVKRMKKDWKLIKRDNFEVCGGSTHDAVCFVLQCFDLLYFARWAFFWRICFINMFMSQ